MRRLSHMTSGARPVWKRTTPSSFSTCRRSVRKPFNASGVREARDCYDVTAETGVAGLARLANKAESRTACKERLKPLASVAISDGGSKTHSLATSMTSSENRRLKSEMPPRGS